MDEANASGVFAVLALAVVCPTVIIVCLYNRCMWKRTTDVESQSKQNGYKNKYMDTKSERGSLKLENIYLMSNGSMNDLKKKNHEHCTSEPKLTQNEGTVVFMKSYNLYRGSIRSISPIYNNGDSDKYEETRSNSSLDKEKKEVMVTSTVYSPIGKHEESQRNSSPNKTSVENIAGHSSIQMKEETNRIDGTAENPTEIDTIENSKEIPDQIDTLRPMDPVTDETNGSKEIVMKMTTAEENSKETKDDKKDDKTENEREVSDVAKAECHLKPPGQDRSFHQNEKIINSNKSYSNTYNIDATKYFKKLEPLHITDRSWKQIVRKELQDPFLAKYLCDPPTLVGLRRKKRASNFSYDKSKMSNARLRERRKINQRKHKDQVSLSNLQNGRKLRKFNIHSLNSTNRNETNDTENLEDNSIHQNGMDLDYCSKQRKTRRKIKLEKSQKPIESYCEEEVQELYLRNEKLCRLLNILVRQSNKAIKQRQRKVKRSRLKKRKGKVGRRVIHFPVATSLTTVDI